jgi:hypothetical protein
LGLRLGDGFRNYCLIDIAKGTIQVICAVSIMVDAIGNISQALQLTPGLFVNI